MIIWYTHKYQAYSITADKMDFMRDIAAYIAVIVTVIGVACDGTVSNSHIRMLVVTYPHV